MLQYLLPLIPEHGCYVEPFAGGATLLFAKKSSSVEVINDTNSQVVNFYRVLKDPEEAKDLYKLCRKTLYSREEHHRAIELFKDGTPPEKAWAFWFKINTGFSGKLDGGFSTTKTPGSSPCRKFHNYKENLKLCGERLENVQVEFLDALDCIDVYDSEETFFYIDPPYVGANQGHYAGYTGEDFYQLMKKLICIKGRFLISCYPSGMVDMFVVKNDWNIFKIEQRIRAKNPKLCGGKQPTKTEMLVWNYAAAIGQQLEMFDEIAG